MPEPNENLAELRKISKILLLANATVVEAELGKIASSDSRKIMWVLIDGTRMPKDIADRLKVTERGIRYFLDSLVTAGFVENPRGQPPKRILDYVPPSWIELVQSKEEQEAIPEASEKPASGKSPTVAGEVK